MTIGLAQPLEFRGRPAEAYGPSMSAPNIGIIADFGGSPEIGAAQMLSTPAGSIPSDPPNAVIGIICSGDLAVHRSTIKAAIKRGLAERPDAVWVCIEPRSDRMTHDLMISLDIDPVILPMNESWRTKEAYDLRRQWRDIEMLHLCDELVIFQKRSGHSPWRDRVKTGFYDRRLYLVEIGPSKEKKK